MYLWTERCSQLFSLKENVQISHLPENRGGLHNFFFFLPFDSLWFCFKRLLFSLQFFEYAVEGQERMLVLHIFPFVTWSLKDSYIEKSRVNPKMGIKLSWFNENSNSLWARRKRETLERLWLRARNLALRLSAPTLRQLIYFITATFSSHPSTLLYWTLMFLIIPLKWDVKRFRFITAFLDSYAMMGLSNG